jgi:hypothetical protein
MADSACPCTNNVVALLAYIDTLRPILSKQGKLQLRSEPGKCPVWRLRYTAKQPTGKLVHRSILMPTHAVARVVEAKIAAWRTEEAAKKPAKPKARKDLINEIEKDVKKLAQAMGLTRAKAADLMTKVKTDAVGGAWELLKVAMSHESAPQFAKPIGRPNHARWY